MEHNSVSYSHSNHLLLADVKFVQPYFSFINTLNISEKLVVITPASVSNRKCTVADLLLITYLMLLMGSYAHTYIGAINFHLYNFQ